MGHKPQPPANSLVFLTNRVGRLLANRIRHRASMEELGILPHHMGILVDLWTRDGVRQQDLAVSTIKDKATIARALDCLEKDNILVRATDPNDKRNKRIYLTNKGKELKGRIWPHAQAVMQEATEGISPEELSCCRQVLEKVYLALR